MSFQPVIPIGGYAGWSLLTRTRDAQQQAFDASPANARNVAYFKENIGKIETAEQLVGDRRLREIALGAFGLDEDINNTFFLRKVLEDGTLEPSALGNRLSDKRYLAFSKAFGFGDFDTPRTVLSGFGDEITSAYLDKQFEAAVGQQDPNMRLAMGLDSTLNDIAEKSTTANGRWFEVMGQPPVRKVFEAALGLPASVGALGLDQQLTAFRDKAQARFGDGEVAQFTDPAKRQELVRLFLLRADSQALNGGTNGQSAALTLLQNASGGAGGLLGLIG
jgi:hypothetical protein